MCDAKRSPACEGIFSELSDDWSTMTGSRFGTDHNGKRIVVQVEMDVCGPCNRGDAPGQTPKMLQDTLPESGKIEQSHEYHYGS